MTLVPSSTDSYCYPVLVQRLVVYPAFDVSPSHLPLCSLFYFVFTPVSTIPEALCSQSKQKGEVR